MSDYMPDEWQFSNARFFGYSIAKETSPELIVEFANRLQKCPSEARVAVFEEMLCRQCEFELVECRIFESFLAGMNSAADELKLAISQCGIS